MVLAVFRTRTDPNTLEEYGRLAEEMSALARTMPGYVSHKGYGAEDGEVLILVEFESEETMRKWGSDPRHLVFSAAAQNSLPRIGCRSAM
jgi:heme-degrading monooxygenase HmoA